MFREYREKLKKMKVEELIYHEDRMLKLYNKKKIVLDSLCDEIRIVRKIWRNKQKGDKK